MSDQDQIKSHAVPVVTIELPGSFYALTGSQRQVSVEAQNIREVLSGLERLVPGVLARIVDEQGTVRRYMNVYRNDNDIRTLEGLETKVEHRDVVWIVPAIAGGQELATEPPGMLPTEYFTHPGPSPHAATTELRAKCPVHRINVPPGAQAYAVLGHEVVEEALSCPALSKQVENLPPPYAHKALENSLLVAGNLGFADPPKHTRLRNPIRQAFLPATIAQLRPDIQRVVDDLIDTFPENGEVELVSAFALQVPLIAICEYLGIPVADRGLFQRWSHVLSQDPFQHAEADLKAAGKEFSEYFISLAAERRKNLGTDLLSILVKARDEDVFSEQELLSTILLLIIAGHKTVANLIGNGTLLLLLQPEQLQMLRTAPSLIPSAIEEILRYEGSAGWASLRVATQPVQLGGVDIPKGSFVHLSLSAAGHDPKVYEDPERFDIARRPNRHLSFGHGTHFCIGAPLARLQGEIVFSTLLRRLPQFELAVRPEEVQWIADSSLSRGLEALPIKVGRRLPR